MPGFMHEARQKARRAGGLTGPGAAGLVASHVAGISGAGTAVSLALQMSAIYSSDKHVSALAKAYHGIYGEAPAPYAGETINSVKVAVRYAIKKKDLKAVHVSLQSGATSAGAVAGAVAGTAVLPVVGTLAGAAVGSAVSGAIGSLSIWSYRGLHALAKHRAGTRGVHRNAAAHELWMGAMPILRSPATASSNKDASMANFACSELLGQSHFQHAVAAYYNSGDLTMGEDMLFGKLKSW